MNYREWISFRTDFSTDGYLMFFCKEENGKMYTAKPITLDYVESLKFQWPAEPTIYVPRMRKEMLDKLSDDLRMNDIGSEMFEGKVKQDAARKDHIASLEATIGKLINMTVALK
jgi:hypothetical protein